ncbi:MAG: hypothetical protein AAGH15_05715 [Myxococcota bacterium]
MAYRDGTTEGPPSVEFRYGWPRVLRVARWALLGIPQLVVGLVAGWRKEGLFSLAFLGCGAVWTFPCVVEAVARLRQRDEVLLACRVDGETLVVGSTEGTVAAIPLQGMWAEFDEWTERRELVLKPAEGHAVRLPIAELTRRERRELEDFVAHVLRTYA